MKRIVLLIALFLLVPKSTESLAQQNITDLKTVAEASNFQSTCDFDDVRQFIDTCAAMAHVRRFDFGKSVEGRPMISAIVANPPYQLGQDDSRLRILLLGNIHSGECAGKESLLMKLRELSLDSRHPWLENAVIVIAPNYNVDANQRVGPFHRPGQIGPATGMGQRENPQQLDLNRDFVKLESPEARCLVSLINQFDPHMFIDCHTTNGTRHQYKLTYDIPHNPTAPQSIRDFLRKKMMPNVTRQLEQDGTFAFFYGNLRNNNWITYGHEPRYSTEYVGLRGRLGILSEAYSYATYKERIDATTAFVEQCVSYVVDHQLDVERLLDDVRQRQINAAKQNPEKILIHLDSKLVAFDEKITIKGLDGDNPTDIDNVTFLGKYDPTTTVSLPYAYVLPQEMSLQAERLKMHGIEVHRLTAATKIPTTSYTVNAITRRERPFQKHQMVRLETKTNTSTVTEIDAGHFVVLTTQPLGSLAAYMLEPETNEGLVTWNFVDRWLVEGNPYPILRVDSLVNDLPIVKLDEIPPGNQLKLTDIFGPTKLDIPDDTSRGAKWIQGGSAYTITKNGRALQVDAKTGAEQRIQTPWQNSATLRDALAKLDNLDRSDISEILRAPVELKSDQQSLFLFKKDDRSFVYDATREYAMELGDDQSAAELAELDPAGNQVAFVQGNNLRLLIDARQTIVDITTDGSEAILNGKLDWVYQEELYGRGNFKSFWWSPDSRAIAFIRIDESPVHRYTVTDHIPTRGQFEITPYPKAGDPLPQVKLGIYSIDRKQLIWAELPELKDENDELLISRVTWNADGSSVMVQLQNRNQTWLDLSAVNRHNGSLKVMFRDETPAWIESPGDPVILFDGSFLWASPRSGYNHIYHYDASGSLIEQVTNGPWEVRELLGASNDGELVYFTGSPQSPTRVIGLQVEINGKNMTPITSKLGTHRLKFNKDFTMFFDDYSEATSPVRTSLHHADGTKLRDVFPNLDDQLRHFKMSKPEFVNVPIGDGLTLNGQLIKPADFDESKKYPVLVHIYAGPQAPRVLDRFGGSSYLWHQYLAQQGYVVWMCDNRSASYNGVRDAWPIHRNLAVNELADIEAGLKWLKNNNRWVDVDRIGIWGWSYGGYMTAFALTNSKSFKAGISGAPVTDWRNYDAIYTERYMDTPQNNPSGYESSSVLPAAGNLHGRLLLIHGTMDDNVHISNSMQFIHELQNAGKQFELMIYPKNRHGVRDPEQQLHLYQLMTNFILKNL